MIKRKYYILFLVCLFIRANTCLAQKTGSEETTSYIINLPPLQDLIDSAYVNSPVIRSQKLLTKQQKFVVSNERSSWLKALALTSNYNYGTNSTNVDGSIGQSISRSATNWYGAGVSLSLPLSVVLNRRRNIQIAKIDCEIEHENLKDIIRTLNKIISEIYINTQLKEKILDLRSDALQTMEINYSLALLEFKDNIMDISSFSKIHETHIAANISFERAKSEYKLSLIKLEETIGIKLR